MNAILMGKLLTELSAYFTVAQFIGTPAGSSGSLMGSSLLLVLAGVLGRAADRAGHPRWRWAALLLAIPAFRIAENRIDRLLLVLPAAYVTAMLARRMGDTTYYQYHDQYRRGLPLMGAAAALLLVFWTAEGMSERVLPHMLCYLVGGVLTLRLLRHSDGMLRSRRLQAYNLLSVGALGVAGWLITSRAAVNALKASLSFLYERMVIPVVMLIGYVMGAIMTGIWMLLSRIDYQGDSELLNDLMQQADREAAEGFEQGAINELPTDVLVGAFILIVFALLAVMLFRFLKKPQAQRQNAIREVRSTIDGAVHAPRARLFDREPRARIRAVYRKFLSLCIGAGAQIARTDTTERIDAIARSALIQPPETACLRDVYRRARYGEAEITESDAEEARRAYRAIREHVKQRG